MPNSADLKCAYNPIGYINSILFQNCREKKCKFYRHFLHLKCSNFVQRINSEIPIF